jgi:holin-like protein
MDCVKIYRQLLIIMAFSFAGDTLSNGLKLPVPGSIIGMILLFLALQFKFIKVESLKEVGGFLLANMTILFLPASVGIMTHWNMISKIWWQLALLVIVGIVLNIAVIGRVAQFVKVKFEGDYVDMNASESDEEMEESHAS